MSITLITGSSSGIGKATALHLASRGHKVYASMQTLDQRQELVAEADDRGLSVELLALDVNHDQSVQAAVAKVLQREGRIDVCINNAGIALIGAIERSDSAIIRQMFETNFFGALRVTRAVLPAMRKQRSVRARVVAQSHPPAWGRRHAQSTPPCGNCEGSCVEHPASTTMARRD